jgi:hypothetical protein
MWVLGLTKVSATKDSGTVAGARADSHNGMSKKFGRTKIGQMIRNSEFFSKIFLHRYE